MPLSILGMPTEVLALVLAACSINTLPVLAATSKLIGEASDERRKRIAVLKLPPFETTPYAVNLECNCGVLFHAGLWKLALSSGAFAGALYSGALPHLKEIHLYGNHIGDSGLQNLCECFFKGALDMLEIIDLSNNQIGDVGVSAFAAVLSSKALPQLTHLVIDHNQIGDFGVSTLADVLSKGALPQLESLILSYNKIGDIGVSDLAKALSKGALQNLVRFGIYNNWIGHVGVSALTDVLSKGKLPHLEVISIGYMHTSTLEDTCKARNILFM